MFPAETHSSAPGTLCRGLRGHAAPGRDGARKPEYQHIWGDACGAEERVQVAVRSPAARPGMWKLRTVDCGGGREQRGETESASTSNRQNARPITRDSDMAFKPALQSSICTPPAPPFTVHAFVLLRQTPPAGSSLSCNDSSFESRPRQTGERVGDDYRGDILVNFTRISGVKQNRPEVFGG